MGKGLSGRKTGEERIVVGEIDPFDFHVRKRQIFIKNIVELMFEKSDAVRFQPVCSMAKVVSLHQVHESAAREKRGVVKIAQNDGP